ncbi:MAG: division/cell wall cluster transcriptional repressor MraZ [archaeon]|nr:division/cell wall cluster transcriptional repressor MraZ [archaeon]
MYDETLLCRLNKRQLFLPHSVVGTIVRDSSDDTKIWQKYIAIVRRDYNLEGISIPFVSSTDKNSRQVSDSFKSQDRLYLFGNSLIIPDDLRSFLELSDRVVLVGRQSYFELWNPNFPEKVFSAIEAKPNIFI